MKTSTGPAIAAKFQRLCEAKGVTIKQAEREIGLSNGYYRKLLLQKSAPSVDRLIMIADYFGVTPDWLLGDEPKGKKGSRGVKIFLLGRVAAGIPIEAEENIIGEEEISYHMAQKGEFFALLIKGDSMSPYILDGDKVIVQQTDEANDRDIVIALINGNDGVCKEFRKTSSGIMLISKNTAYEPLVFTRSDMDSEPVKILGRVVEIRRPL